MEILSVSFGEEVRQALSYADVTLRACNKTVMVEMKKENVLLQVIKIYILKRVRAKQWNDHLPPKTWQLTFAQIGLNYLSSPGGLTSPHALVGAIPCTQPRRGGGGKTKCMDIMARSDGGVSSNAPLCSCNAQGEKDLSPVLVHHTRPLLALTHAAAAPALCHSHRLNSEMDEGGKFQQKSITQSFTAEQNEICKRVLTCWKRGNGLGMKKRERERAEKREQA